MYGRYLLMAHTFRSLNTGVPPRESMLESCQCSEHRVGTSHPPRVQPAPTASSVRRCAGHDGFGGGAVELLHADAEAGAGCSMITASQRG